MRLRVNKVETGPLSKNEVLKVLPAFWMSGITTQKDQMPGAGCNSHAKRTVAVAAADWPARRAAAVIRYFAKHDGLQEAWQPLVDARVLVLYNETENSSCPPVGFVAFIPALSRSSATDPAARFDLTLELAWLAPHMRGRGMGHQLPGHMWKYLLGNNIPRSLFATPDEGLVVNIILAQDTPGGRWFSSRVRSFFEQDQTRRAEEHRRWGRWVEYPILSVSESIKA